MLHKPRATRACVLKIKARPLLVEGAKCPLPTRKRLVFPAILADNVVLV